MSTLYFFLLRTNEKSETRMAHLHYIINGIVHCLGVVHGLGIVYGNDKILGSLAQWNNSKNATHLYQIKQNNAML